MKALPLLALGLPFSIFASASALAWAPGDELEDPQVMTRKEKALRALDLSTPGWSFKQLGAGTTPTNWGVKDANGKYVANLKCTAGNTYAPSAVAAYGLGRFLEFPIYPVAVRFDGEITVNGTSLKGRSCVLKEWSETFSQLYWSREQIEGTSSGNREQRKILDVVKNCGARYEDTDVFSYEATSKYGSPKVGSGATKYRGASTIGEAARDFSNMMVMDALIGNDDRFPGGNVHFRTRNETARIEGGEVVFEEARLFSLDNEAAFKRYLGSVAHRDLKRIKRFDTRMLDRLEELRTRLLRNDLLNDPETAFLDFPLLKDGAGRSARESVIASIDYVMDLARAPDACRF
jgi:hypothetical protein